ncbi:MULTISPECIES: hypothetical protein [unclassified Microcoleus]|uniref:hypothetical protein n=1 Tax=unclassified Microcoleus TaxID=2642155 RepID=UPI002FCEA19C
MLITLEFLTADGGGYTRMDADEFSLVLDARVARNRVFARYCVTVGKNGKKPGFFGF